MASNVPSERNVLLRVLGSSRDPATLQRLLDMTKDGDKVRSQDVRSVFRAVAAGSAEGGMLAWSHLQANWAWLFGRFGRSSFTLGAIIKEVTSHFSTRAELG